jgi:hypothetical protein
MTKISRREALGLLGGIGAQLVVLDALGATCGPPPPAKKQRWKGGESFPPLPLPVTPLRRSEKKRPPAPPALIGKLQYGKVVTGTDANGRRYSYRDWTTDPGDIRNLMNQANVELGINYRPMETTFEQFSFKPQEIPLLLLTGHEGFSFSLEERSTIRRFLNDGGSLLGDACCGMEDYRKAFLAEINQIFPQRKIKILPSDHPIYTSYHTIAEVGYKDAEKGTFSAPPVLEGISIGCREAVLLSQYDLTCGWDGHGHDQGKRVWPPADAVKLGVNMLAYSLATYRLGQYLAATINYQDTNPDTSGALVIGQIVHGGDWDPNPSSLMTLLKHSARRSTMSLKFRREDVVLGKSGATEHPILYMTGHDDFTFSPTEIAHLRSYLRAGGVLFADACCGRSAFDQAFRREIRKIVPERKLEPLDPAHPLFRTVADSTKITSTPALAAKRQGAGQAALSQPELEAIALGGSLSVIYSPLSIGCGWEDEACPYCLGYDPASARDLGLNILAYALTH